MTSTVSTASWIDAHCHLSDPRISESELKSVLQRSQAAGVKSWISGGVEPAEWLRQKALKKRLGPNYLTSFGLHPWWVRDHSALETEKALSILRAELPEADALGELGLDFYPKPGLPEWTETAREHQAHFFRAQLLLANEMKKPIILHVVKAHEEALEHLNRHPPKNGGLVHAFTGSYEIARRYLALGLKLSIGAAITRPNAYQTLKQGLLRWSREDWVLETDSPDQPSPVWERPTADAPAHEPAALPKIAEAAAQLLIAAGVERTATDILHQSRNNLAQIWPSLNASD